MGLGLLGRGIGITKFLAEHGALLTVTDLKTKEELAPALEKLAELKNITYVLGEHRLEDFSKADMVIRAPNAPLDSIYLAEARKNNVPIKMDASLFAELVPEDVTLIGVTGTRGKSTAVQLVYEMLKLAGKSVYLGGNVRDTATLPLLDIVKSGDYVVLELDSWQLQGFDEDKVSPTIAVFTSFFPDHLNYYAGDMQRYWHDKASIFRHQKPGDKLIVSTQIQTEMWKHGESRKLDAIADVANVSDWKIRMRGEHNKLNVTLARETAKLLGVNDDVIKKVAESFGGLPGRQEIVGEANEVLYVNDTNGTSPEAVMAALESFSDYKGKIILLCGGFDKGLDYRELVAKFPEYLKALILFKGTASDKIEWEIGVGSWEIGKFVNMSTMHEAFAKAQELAKPGDVVLLSPGAASFGIFKNEYDRGDQFIAEVKAVKP